MLKLSKFVLGLLAVMLVTVFTPAYANGHGEKVVTLYRTAENGTGDTVGTVTLKDTIYGLLLTPNLANLAPGMRGFHIHENPSCSPAEKNGRTVPGGAAGGHFDPLDSNSHEGPYGDGHLGDLPPLYVAPDGTATTPVLAPRLRLRFVRNRAVMVHLRGDNFSDEPVALGGGGPRSVCGVISRQLGS